ncbi:MAG: beta-glucosidase [Halococcoides sp.]
MNDQPEPDSSRPISERVADLRDQMMVREKVGQLAGTYVGTMWTHKGPEDVAREIREYDLGSAVPFGVSAADTTDPVAAAELANRLQQVAIEETRLGIPLLIPVDAVHGHAYVAGTTVLPHGLGMGATRRPDLARSGADVTASECRATGASIAYSPTADIAADQRWGRAFETFGETPALAGAFARAKVEGLQSAGPREESDLAGGVAACVKHFPAYGQPTGGEDAAPVDVSETTLRRRFLPPFEDVIEADPAVMMPCYNAVGADPAHASEGLLGDLLRGELGFSGAVFSDWTAIRMLEEDHHVARDHREATSLARRAGVDVASVDGPDHVEALVDLIEAGELSEERIDRQVERVLELKFELGLFDDPYVDVDRVREQLFTDEHRATALEAARKSMTLLDNDGLLPLSANDDVLVTGPNADSLVGQCGGWSWPEESALAGTTVREGLNDAFDGAVGYEPGADHTDERDLDAVADAAADADAAVAVVGEGWYIHEFGGDGQDAEDWPRRDSISLPPAQRRLLETLYESDTPVAVVLVSGRPLALTGAAEHAEAVLMAYYPGSAGGTAIAETLVGDVNPGGALPVSIPRSASRAPERIEDCPHPTPIGAEHHLDSYDPLYAFGHGLSYTEFDVGAPDAPATVRPGDRVTVTVPVTNVGDRAGERAVDVFVRDRVSSVVTPRREHVGFDRVAVDPGETATATVEFPAAELAVQDGRERRIEPGEFEVIVGEESATIELESDY